MQFQLLAPPRYLLAVEVKSIRSNFYLAHEAPGTHKRFLNWTQITYFCPNYDIKKFGHKVAMFLGNCSQICYAPTYMKVSERRQGFPSHTINCTNEPRGHTPESGSLQLLFYYFISHRKFCITLIFIIWKIEKFSPHEQTFQFPYYPQKLYYNKSVYVMGRLYTVCKSDLPFVHFRCFHFLQYAHFRASSSGPRTSRHL